MEPNVTIYDSHWSALDAIEMLISKGYPANRLSLLGRVKIITSSMRVNSKEPTQKTSESLCVVLDSTIRVLSRASVFAIPGHGLLIGAGAVKHIIDDNDMGNGINEIFSILTTIGLEKENITKFGDDLINGKYLVVAEGNDMEIEDAGNILFYHEKQQALWERLILFKKKNQIYSNYIY
jgi:hypothetical protein